MKSLAIGLIVVAGCGVNEYQQRMDAQRERIQDLDDTNALLDDALEMPTVHADIGKEISPAWPFNVYLRLPKDFGTTPKEKTPYYVNFPFYRYGGADPGYNLFVAAAFVAESDAKQEVLKFTKGNFRVYTRRAVEDYYVKTTKIKLTLPEKIEERSEIVKPFTPYPDDLKPMRYLYHEYNDLSNVKLPGHTLFRVYIFEEEGKQVCIVEQRPLRVPNDNFDKAMKACLRTLDIGPDAASKRKKFTKTRT
jgi:hypothetical protein